MRSIGYTTNPVDRTCTSVTNTLTFCTSQLDIDVNATNKVTCTVIESKSSPSTRVDILPCETFSDSKVYVEERRQNQ